MPAVDLESGKVLLSTKDHIALSPDGHGGILMALASPGADGSPSCLEEMRASGVRTLFYFQVDNPLVRIADPAFLGLHRESDAEMSFKVVERLSPDEKLGVVVSVGRTHAGDRVFRPSRRAGGASGTGRPAWNSGPAASPCISWSAPSSKDWWESTAFPSIERSRRSLIVDGNGQPVKPAESNAVKFEQFIFDALPMAQRWTIVETDRAGEFEPLKNAVGPDSPATVHQRMSDQFGSWLEQAGATVLRRHDGSVAFGIEISPLFALDAAELKSKIEPGLVVERPLYLR